MAKTPNKKNLSGEQSINTREKDAHNLKKNRNFLPKLYPNF